jgi:hypothetical protein
MIVETVLPILPPQSTNSGISTMKVNVLRIATAVAAVVTTAAHAHGLPEFFRSEFSDAVAVGEVNSPSGDGCPIESADGLSLFIASNRDGTAGGNDIWAADRDSLTSPWKEPRNLGAPINTSAADFCPTPVLVTRQAPSCGRVLEGVAAGRRARDHLSCAAVPRSLQWFPPPAPAWEKAGRRGRRAAALRRCRE